MLMQQKSRDQREQHVAQRSCGQNVSEIGPGKRSHVRGEESQQKKNSNGDPRIKHSKDDALQMIKGNAAGLLHPMRKQRVSGRGEDRDSGQHKILAKVHGKFKRYRTGRTGFIYKTLSPRRHGVTEKTKNNKKFSPVPRCLRGEGLPFPASEYALASSAASSLCW